MAVGIAPLARCALLNLSTDLTEIEDTATFSDISGQHHSSSQSGIYYGVTKSWTNGR